MQSGERWCDKLVKERGGANFRKQPDTYITQQPNYKQFGHL